MSAKGQCLDFASGSYRAIVFQDPHQINPTKKTGRPADNARAQAEPLMRALARLNLVAAGVGTFVAEVHDAVANRCGLSLSGALWHLFSLPISGHRPYVIFVQKPQ